VNIHILEKLRLAMAASTGARLQRKAARTAVSAAAAPSFRRCYGPEFVAKAVREWIAAVGASTAYIMPGSPWENGYCESFNSKLRDELLDGEVFCSLAEAKIVIERWRRHHNTSRPHSALGYRPPAPEVVLWTCPLGVEGWDRNVMRLGAW
jgi:putative transposase